MEPSAPTGLRHLIHASRWSWAGLCAAWQETAFRQEILAMAILIPVALIFGQSPVEQALLIGSLFVVLVAELLNTAVEAAIDRIGPERHPLSGRAKDLGSAAVLVAVLGNTLVWGVIVRGWF